jgi:hypothetical protein
MLNNVHLDKIIRPSLFIELRIHNDVGNVENIIYLISRVLEKLLLKTALTLFTIAKRGVGLGAYQQMNGERKCGICT